MKLISFGLVLGSLSMTLLACATESEDESEEVGSGASDSSAPNVFEQVKTCDNLFKDRAAFRDPDLGQGVLRWKCGDVDRITISKCEDDLDLLARAERERSENVDDARGSKLPTCGDGYGQEYCEYNAVSKGLVVNSVNAAKALENDDVVQCVFTSVHSDLGGRDAEAHAKTLAAKLQTELASAERAPEIRVATMQQRVNSRGAADTLIQDCSDLGRSPGSSAKNAERQTRCYRAWSSASASEKARLESACKEVDLSDDRLWARTGLDEQVKLSDADEDLAACTMVLKAEHGGVPWRNSDPTICARAYRATKECGVAFNPIGVVAPNFQGFSMQGWTNRDVLPVGCKYARVDGEAYAQIVICTPSEQDVRNYRTQRKPLQTLCRDKFGANVAMQAPVGALAKLDGAREETPFCQAFVRGARAAQKPVSGGQ